MKQLETVKSMECYSYDSEYNVDVIEINENYEAWLYKQDYGFKSLLFGMPVTQQPKDVFLRLVESNIAQYISFYEEEISILEKERE